MFNVHQHSTILFYLFTVIVDVISTYCYFFPAVVQYQQENPVAIIAGSVVAIAICIVFGLIMITVIIRRYRIFNITSKNRKTIM